MTSGVFPWLASIPWFAWIPIAAILCGSVSGIFKMRYDHAERMEMLRQGINPDGGKPAGPPDV